MKNIFVLIFTMLSVTVYGQSRTVFNLKKWDFSHDSVSWSTVTVPHDWAIDGPFDKKWDLQTVAIEQNGEKVATEKSGRSGALPWIGKGYYKTSFVTKSDRHAEIMFDGAMSEPVVWINGQYAGKWAYGYNAFSLDITKLLNPVGQENTVVVSLQNLPESSRWYPGAGLYRPVTVTFSDSTRINTWGTFFKTNYADAMKAEVEVVVQTSATDNNAQIQAVLYDKHNTKVTGGTVTVDNNGEATVNFTVNKPNLWSPEDPYLYKLTTTLLVNGKAVDCQEEKVGIRTISISESKGFQLNGKTRKFKGVCLHHDLGPLGAATNKAALIRQVNILKDMGADAIRTAHNMPSRMQMEVYDSLGMMVMAESTDTWKDTKVKNGYNRFYDEWIDRDITNLILNHRNHPSIVMWSIGNEIPEQWKKEGAERARHLVDLCHSLDPTRTVTAGCDQVDAALKSGFLAQLDVPGLNYRVHKYQTAYKNLPHGYLLGSETTSTVSSRGEYFKSIIPQAMATHSNGQCSGYDNEYCSWSNLPDDDWALQDDYDWVIGKFVWTGFDYLGEPTPYDEYWPSRSSYFGICDLAGLPKDRYYLYRSRWNTKEKTVHLLPHWNWNNGDTIPVECYTNFDSAELFVNGKSVGKARKYDPTDTTTAYKIKTANGTPLNRYRIIWDSVRYEPGTLEVVCYDKNGNEAGRTKRYTAGKAERLLLTADKKALRANGEDLIFITVSAVDRNGNLCPLNDDQLTFSVDGTSSFKAVCNGDATSLESFTKPTMKLFHGQLVVILQSSTTPGNTTLTVNSPSGLYGEMMIGSF